VACYEVDTQHIMLHV